MTLSDEMLTRIRDYSVKVCGSNSEAAEELATHLEDEMLDYLAGTRALDEDEAFVLAREHLGPLADVRKAYRSESAQCEFRERCVLALIAFLIASIAGSLVPAIVVLADILTDGLASQSAGWATLETFGRSVVFAVTFVALLLRWRPHGDEAPSARPWVRRITPRARTLVTIALAAIFFCLPRFQRSPYFGAPPFSNELFVVLTQAALIAGALVATTLGLWFLAGDPTTARRRLQSALLIFGALMLSSTVHPAGIVYAENGAVHYTRPSLTGVLALPAQPSTVFLVFVLPYAVLLAVALFILWVRDRRSLRPLQLAS